MKNFARLVHFAWPYKVRFGLSIVCAAMVALLFFAELGAVYPLLHILIDSQDPQRWVSAKIASIQDDLLTLEARRTEVLIVEDFEQNQPRNYDVLKQRFRRISEEFEQKEKDLREYERRVSVAELKDHDQLAQLESLRRDHRVGEARRKELADCSSMLLRDDEAALQRRR